MSLTQKRAVLFLASQHTQDSLGVVQQELKEFLGRSLLLYAHSRQERSKVDELKQFLCKFIAASFLLPKKDLAGTKPSHVIVGLTARNKLFSR